MMLSQSPQNREGKPEPERSQRSSSYKRSLQLLPYTLGPLSRVTFMVRARHSKPSQQGSNHFTFKEGQLKAIQLILPPVTKTRRILPKFSQAICLKIGRNFPCFSILFYEGFQGHTQIASLWDTPNCVRLTKLFIFCKQLGFLCTIIKYPVIQKNNYSDTERLHLFRVEPGFHILQVGEIQRLFYLIQLKRKYPQISKLNCPNEALKGQQSLSLQRRAKVSKYISEGPN